MNSDPIQFLANIVRIAYADGKVSASESFQLNTICSELRIKKAEYKAAVKLVENKEHTMKPVGSFSEHVKNLEMILRVAYAGKTLGEKGAKLIQEFSDAAGIYPDQVEKIRTEVNAVLREICKTCSACGSKVEKDARFCSKCGANITSEEASVKLQYDIPNSGIAIEFVESGVAAFPEALEIAKRSHGFQSCRKNNKNWYLAVYATDNLADTIPLVGALSGMRNRGIYINGVKQNWDEAFGFIYCASHRIRAFDPLEYCFGANDNYLNIWGCTQVHMDWSEYGDWFSYGKWEIGPTPQWRFDKQKIKHQLKSNLFEHRYCPFLIPGLCDAVISNLPDIVTPAKDSNWEFNHLYKQVPGSIKVTEEVNSCECVFKEEFWSDSVRPRGQNAYVEILSKALHELGVHNIPVRKLAKAELET